MSEPGLIARALSSVVRVYLKRSPLERGKTRLMQHTASFGVARLEAGPWIRVSGLVDFEWEVFTGRRKEPASCSIFRRLLGPGMTVFDVGANIGYYSLQAAPLVGADGTVHAFEPTPVLAERVRENARLNGFSNLRVNACGVGDQAGTMTLHLSREDPEANSLFASGESYDAVQVRVTTLDDYVAAQRIARVDVVKIDCEGAEPLVLRGGERLFSGDDAPVVLAEVNPVALRRAGTNAEELVGTLKRRGYRCHLAEQLTSGPDGVFNVLATKAAAAQRLPALAELSLEQWPAA